MTQEARRPLHRLTPLVGDPATSWLSRPQALRVAMNGWIRWVLFAVVWLFILFSCFRVLPGLLIPIIVAFSAGAALLWPWRRMTLRACNETATALIRSSAPSQSTPVDDFGELDGHADGTIVSIVGWIRARNQLPQPVAGEPCIGLALACHQRYPGVLETLNDFELVDEGGRAVQVQVAGGRMLGASNVHLADANARRLLIASLDLPVGAVATGWDAFVLRDGDPVMVVGFKLNAVDPTQASLRAPPARAAVASMPPKPLLIFPIAAERRVQPAALFNLS